MLEILIQIVILTMARWKFIMLVIIVKARQQVTL